MAQRHIALTTLVVRDYDEAIAFYCDKVGFELIEDTPLGGPKRWVVMAPAGQGAGGGAALLLARADGEAQAVRVGDQTGGRVGFFLYTDDFERDYAAMSARGVRFIRPVSRERYGVVSVWEDLYGNRWDLLQPA
ncbi:MAG TPA: VOC family protein [Caulobacteraceae bacterium]|jgi:catechol 2,3-dioxygenase-like lactoylglutathione lyase family enzyme|nr:VOC family protein [Caulobacteraceae bacterium]